MDQCLAAVMNQRASGWEGAPVVTATHKVGLAWTSPNPPSRRGTTGTHEWAFHRVKVALIQHANPQALIMSEAATRNSVLTLN